MALNLEYIGGRLWAAEEPGPDGYGKTVICLEIEAGKETFVVELGRPLTKSELEQVIQLVQRETVQNP